jgi:peptidyl-prolyl cis-trans isomerase C
MLVKNMEMSQGPIPAEKRDEILRGALDRLIEYTVLQQEAKDRKLTVAEAEVDERLKGMQSQFPKEEDFRKALEARGMSLERLRADARVDMIINKMLDAEVATAPPATDQEVRAFYEKNPEKFKQEEAVRASHILILADEKADEATRKKARSQIDAILKRARAGEDFAKLAQAHSQDGSAAQGGDLDFFTRDRMVPPFSQAAFALKIGEISDVVTTQFGYHVIKLTERRPAEQATFDESKPRIEAQLQEERRQAAVEALVTEVRGKAKIKVEDSRLAD